MEITEKVSPEFPNYIIKSDGSVWNKKGEEMHQYEKKKYKCVYLYKDKKRFFKLVHRLVAETFIPNLQNFPEINHKDENPSNNRIDNLEWCDRIYNSNYGTLKKRRSEKMKKNNPFKGKKHSKESIERIRQKKIGQPSKRRIQVVIDGIKYNSITEAMQKLKISTKKMYKILREGL